MNLVSGLKIGEFCLIPDEFIWYSEKNDWGHIYLYDSKY